VRITLTEQRETTPERCEASGLQEKEGAMSQSTRGVPGAYDTVRKEFELLALVGKPGGQQRRGLRRRNEAVEGRVEAVVLRVR
jgi:hypothetical protein